ncbi:MAG: CDP-diacylglycerol--glycerol-3-phosphate 3-phosphatidyltransferase [bacterium]
MSLPNQLTLLRIALTPAVVVALYFETLAFRIAALVVFLFAALTDWYDGRLARKLNYVSKLGNFLDPLADKILVLSTFFALACNGVIDMWMVVAITIRDAIITLLRVYADWKRQPVVTSVSAKWKTASQMAALYLILLYLILRAALPNPSGPGWGTWSDWDTGLHVMMQAVTWITLATAVQYLFENRHHVRSLALACLRVFAPGNLAK